MATLHNKSGMRFGRLLVIHKVSPPNYVSKETMRASGSWWLCRCDCGNQKVVSAIHLKEGDTVSCGCYRLGVLKGPKNKPINVDPFSSVFREYRDHSKEKGRPFLLTFQEFKDLCLGNCHYCGRGPESPHKYGGRKRSKTVLRNGIDRIDSSKGYTVENSVTCCEVCNRAKRDMPIGEFEDWLRRAYWHYCVDRNFEP